PAGVSRPRFVGPRGAAPGAGERGSPIASPGGARAPPRHGAPRRGGRRVSLRPERGRVRRRPDRPRGASLVRVELRGARPLPCAARSRASRVVRRLAGVREPQSVGRAGRRGRAWLAGEGVAPRRPRARHGGAPGRATRAGHPRSGADRRGGARGGLHRRAGHGARACHSRGRGRQGGPASRVERPAARGPRARPCGCPRPQVGGPAFSPRCPPSRPSPRRRHGRARPAPDAAGAGAGLLGAPPAAGRARPRGLRPPRRRADGRRRARSGRHLMQINRLRLCNFRQHEHTDLALGAGLTGIIGPNGAGKTTILEGIAWAMYGMPAARGSRETIRRRGAPPRSRVEVELEFTLGAHQYRVLRTLHGAELYQDGDPAPIANSIGAVTERVTRLLGMTRDELFNTYFTGQKELAVMAAMSAPERAQFLSRVLGYERIRAAQDRLKERRSALRARHEALRGGLGDLAEIEAAEARARDRATAARVAETAAAAAAAAAERCLAEVRPRWERLQQLRETALTLEAELRVADHQTGAAAERAQR